MNFNSRGFFKAIALIFSLALIVSANSFNAKFPDGDKDTKLTRPRIYKTEPQPKSEEASVPKAVVSFELEHKVFDLINKQRATMGLEPLVWNDEVAKIARFHSENMANQHFFSHEGTDGSMVNDRADLFGVSKWRAIGENIAYSHGYTNPAEFAVERWMQSPGHRENILNERWKESGIGVAVTADHTYYFTEVFLLRK